jgi:hypothetical protein
VIDPLDDILRDLIQSRIATIRGPTQFDFAPPHADCAYLITARSPVTITPRHGRTRPRSAICFLGVASSFTSSAGNHRS